MSLYLTPILILLVTVAVTMSSKRWVIARPVNGITINGDEYLLDENYDIRRFTYEDAVSLCVEHSLSLDYIKEIDSL